MFASLSAVAGHGVHAAVLVAAAVPIGYLLVAGGRHDRKVARLRAARDVGARAGVDGIVAAAERRARAAGVDARAPRPRPRSVIALALAMLTAGVVHGGVCPQHFTEGVRFGVFFLAVAVAQFAVAAAAALGHWRAVLGPTLVLNLGIVALWVVSRAAGLPFHLAAREPVGSWDVLASVAEVVAAGAAAVLLCGLRRVDERPVVVRRELAKR